MGPIPNDCRPQIQACATRVARLESNGVPSPGDDNLYVSDALVSLSFTVETAEGEEMEIINACGEPCLSFKDDDKIRRLSIEFELCTPDPELTELLVGGSVLTDGDAVGYGFPQLNTVPNPNGVSLELWAKRVTSGGTLDPEHPYARWVFPLTKLFIDSATFENGPFQPTFQGFAVENENWFDGPTNDWPVDSDKVAQWLPVTTLPETSCGYQVLAAS